MEGMHCYWLLLAATLLILTRQLAATGTFAPHEVVQNQDERQILQFSPQTSSDTNQGDQSTENVVKGNSNEKAYKRLSTLGSRPPNCEHKCRGCRPCIAVQAPKTAGNLGVQYANYEPEGWICKCGSSFFIP